jgi:hypothetical protein
LSLRQDASRSTPSLLSQPSPPRQPSSPGLRKSNGNIARDSSRRNGSSGTTSPARSTFSLASTANIYATVSGTSNSTTPGTIGPSSPPYYDYTEDFEIDSYNRVEESLGSPLHFSINRTTPEEPPRSAERRPSTKSRVHQLSCGLRPSSSPTPTTATTKPLEGTQNQPAVLLHQRQLELIQPSRIERHASIQVTSNCINKNIIRLSGLEFGAQELSTHVEEAFGLLPEKAFEVSVSQIESAEITSGNLNGEVLTDEKGVIAETQFTSNFSNRGDAYPPRFSSLPSSSSGSRTDAIVNPEPKRSVNNISYAQTSPDPIQLPLDSTSLLDPSKSREVGITKQGSQFRRTSTSSQSWLRSTSGFKSFDPGFSELSDLLRTIELSDRRRHLEEAQPVFTPAIETPILAPPFLNGSNGCSTKINHAQSPIIPSFNLPSAKELHASTQLQLSKRSLPHNGDRRKVETPTLAAYERFDTPIFSNQTAMRVIPHSGPPLLAPKPISPARQLKLKNSVPQLMKALPPLPPEPLVRSISPVNVFKLNTNQMQYHSSTSLPELSTTSVQGLCHESHKVVSAQRPPIPPKEELIKAPTEFVLRSSDLIAEHPLTSKSSTIPQPPPRLKLKMKSFKTLRPLSSQRRGLVEEDIYSCTTPDPDTPVQKPLLSEKSANLNPPKFRLKITRASTSTYGTVRVNRESAESKETTGFHLPMHKDLFTSTSGIDHIFRQVSQHFHSRKAGVACHTGSGSAHAPTALVSAKPRLAPGATSPTTDFDFSQPQSRKPLPSREARSVFSDDSSHIQGYRSMRGRLSNLRARIASPYTNRIGAQSNDDLTWRDRNLPETAAPMGQRFASNMHSSCKNTEYRPLRRFAERMHHRLKEKVQGLIKEARTAVKSRLK